MSSDSAISAVYQNRAISRASQVLTGIVTGIVADGQLHDLELSMLSTWLAENQEATTGWPGSTIARQLREILADGIVTDPERQHLLKVLTELAGSDFSESGSVTPEVAGLPYGDWAHDSMQGLCLCLTGQFISGTRAACEKLSANAGAILASSVSRKVHYLVVGTNVSPSWITTSYGRKIQQAMDLKTDGHHIVIVPERIWMSAVER